MERDRLTGSTGVVETASFASGSPQTKTDKKKLRKMLGVWSLIFVKATGKQWPWIATAYSLV